MLSFRKKFLLFNLKWKRIDFSFPYRTTIKTKNPSAYLRIIREKTILIKTLEINFEYFSNSFPECDVELISLGYNFLKNIKIPINLYISTLGDKISRKRYVIELNSYFKKNKKELSKDSINRIDKNPLRILDTKDKNDLEIIKEAPKIINYLSDYSNNYYSRVDRQIPWIVRQDNFNKLTKWEYL